MFSKKPKSPPLGSQTSINPTIVRKIGRKPILLSGFLAAMVWPLSWLVWEPPLWQAKEDKLALSAAAFQAGVGVTVFANDSLGDLTLDGDTFELGELDSLFIADFDFEFTSLDASCIQVIYDASLYQERWDSLTHIQFWRQIMSMPKDTCIVSRMADRKILGKIPTWQWVKMNNARQAAYKDSLRTAYELAPNSGIYVTAGKNHYYNFDDVLYQITGALRVFRELNVDPWFAQAILLIESPGRLNRSPVGAYGPFQLMPEVADEFGLIVSDSLDERENLTKSATAAAMLIRRRCVPLTRFMLRKRNIPFNEEDTFFRMLVLHCYHAGAGNVEAVLAKLQPTAGGVDLMKSVWQTEAGGFKNASQNYSQLAIAAFLELDQLMMRLPEDICHEMDEVFAAAEVADEESETTAAAP